MRETLLTLPDKCKPPLKGLGQSLKLAFLRGPRWPICETKYKRDESSYDLLVNYECMHVFSFT